jgi:CheY-like chemotaxis protein
MDIRLPGMDGITASKEINSYHGENAPKIIAYTALDMKENAELFAEIINKPMNQKGFSEKLLAVLNG